MNGERDDYSELTKVMYLVMHCLYVCDRFSETQNRRFLMMLCIKQFRCALFHSVVKTN